MTRERFTENPFYILGLRPECSRADMEREGQKLLAMLELGMASAKTYPTPLGPTPRTADSVRQAMAELRDPQRRIVHELWAQLPATPPASPPVSSSPAAASNPVPPPGAAPAEPGTSDAEPAAASGPPPPWPDARAALGFGARR